MKLAANDKNFVMDSVYSHTLGLKNYELTNHLENQIDDDKKLHKLKRGFIKKARKKIQKIVSNSVSENDNSILSLLENTLNTEKENGIILNEVTKGYFRLKRKSKNDCSPIFELLSNNEFSVQEALLEVLGYDKMIPSIEEQKLIIDMYFLFGQGIDLNSFCDPRYGLAAACAGWDKEIVRDFLNHCIATGDAPLKYVSENSLKGKYVKLR
ncbi:MAG: hypothetical protein M0P12_14010 [Paludibacteraceae bacterium]|nr:hypothetical protein [Paludibacteraceae bacterium]